MAEDAAIPELGTHVVLGGAWNGSEGVVEQKFISDTPTTNAGDLLVHLTLSRRDGYKTGDRVAVRPEEAKAAKVLTVILTEEQINILLSITGPRIAHPDALRYNDWSIDLDRRLREALETR